MDYLPKHYVHGNKIIARINKKDAESKDLYNKYINLNSCF